ncbi:MAG TPA: DUF2917 domain-containing protein [Deltaproteobacteria bacterium]|jgi:hypothetical protein|nr:DUF2917 domain-containing protein [Deltaproteobacteria bacterium]HOI06158.1 DUF2917 domain-containing protein [Deltaproteobacteria bacterium]
MKGYSGMKARLLRRGQALGLPHVPQGCTVLCLEGVIWVTQENDPADHILAQASLWSARGPGLVVVEALEDAVFRIIEHEAPYAGIISKEAV